jgi:hypothetical protein
LKRTSQSDNVQQTDISFAPFDSSDVVPMEIGKFGEPFLRETTLNP